MRRLADVFSVIGTLGMVFCGLESIIYGDKTPSWLTPQIAFGICGFGFVLVILGLAVQRSWHGPDKTNKLVNSLCCFTVILLVIAVNVF